MRTTLDIADHLLIQAKQRAAAQRTSIKALVEEGLRRVLEADGRRVAEPMVPYAVPLLRGQGGLVAGVDPTDSSALLELTDADPDVP